MDVSQMENNNSSSIATTCIDNTNMITRRRSSSSSTSKSSNADTNGIANGNGRCAPFTTKKNSHCITIDGIEDVIARIVHRVDLQESHEGSGTTADRWNGHTNNNDGIDTSNNHSTNRREDDIVHGPLTSREISELSFLCSAISSTTMKNHGNYNRINNNSEVADFSHVDVDSVLSLIELLDRHVNLAVATNVIENTAMIAADTTKSPSQITAMIEQWLSLGEGQRQLATLSCGLEAAAIILFILNTPNIDRRVLLDDTIKGVVTLMRLHLSRHLIPAINQTGHFLSEGSIRNNQQGSPNAKRRRVSESSDGAFLHAKDLKKVYKYVVATMELQLALMDRIEGVITTLPLDDQQILMITSGVLPSFEIDCNTTSISNSKESFQVQQLQTTSINILTAAFRKYPMHRDIMLEDLFPVMLNLPTGKRSLRTFPVRYTSSPTTTLKAVNAEIIGPLLSNGGQPHYIQMITALILSLVQSCVVRPTYASEDNVNVDTENANKPGKLQSGLQPCLVVADTFVRFLLKRCIKTKGDNANEYRPFLVNVVEDLLLVLIIPEYPAAEVLLSALQRRFNQDLTLASPIFSPNQSAPEITYLNCTLDLMGKICSVQARLLAVAEERPLLMISEPPMSNLSSSEQDIEMHCYCKCQNTDVFRIQCDYCNSIYHGVCVGLPDKESVPDEWFCDSCTLGRIITDEKQRANGSEESTIYLDQIYAMRHLYHSVTANQIRMIDENKDDPVKISLARWVDEIDQKNLTNSVNSGNGQGWKCAALSKLFTYWDADNSSLNADSLSEEGGIRIIINLITQTSKFFLSFRKQVEFILKHMTDENPQFLRKLSMKIIEKCVEGDPNLMLLPIIKKAVSKRLSDESTSVREAAVSLIGNYIARSPIAIKTYHSVLIPCLTDSGISVRKRAVKIFQSILIRNPYYQGRKEVFNVLIQRSVDPKEEDSVRDVVDETLSVLWFRSGTLPISQQRSLDLDEPKVKVVSIPGVVTPNTPLEPVRRNSVQSRSDVTAEQLMEVVQASNAVSSLEAVLIKLLKIEAEFGGGKNSESAKGLTVNIDGMECSQIVDSLCELLVVIDEQRAIRPRIGQDISATLKTLAIFATVSPVALLKHIDSLLPYLKADNGVGFDDEASIICAICDILYRLAPLLNNLIIPKQTSLIVAKDFTKISYKFGPSVLVSAIRAFTALANESSSMGHNVFIEKLLALGKIFYSYALKKNDVGDFSLIGEQLKSSVHRALTVLGVICEYRVLSGESSTLDDNDNFDTEEFILDTELTWETFTKACYILFRSFLAKNDSATKCRALAALKGIFVAKPQLLLQLDHVGLFDDIMSDAAGEPLQLEALECWRNILEAEERRIESGRAAAMMESNENVTLSKRISGDQNSDATLFGGILTNHSKRLYEMTKDSRSTIRLSTLTLLGLLLRQGLLNPNEVIPHLFALQGDTGNESIRTLALQLLIIEGEKRPDVLRQRICAGVKEAYAFQRAIYPSKAQACAVVVKQGDATIVQCIFGSVFEECIAKNRKQRLGLYKTLLGLFEADQSDQTTDSSKTRTDVFLLSFVAQILAHLPYNMASDPLYIVYYVTSITVLQGQYIMDQLSDLLHRNGILNSADTYENIVTEDVFEKAARNKFPSRTQEARQLSSKDFDLKSFKKLVSDGTVVSLLLRLKSFLCKTYNLSETRCLEFDPNEKGRLCEKTFSPIKFHQVFDATVAAADGPIDKDLLLRQYAEFRRLLRSDTSGQVRTSTHLDEPKLQSSSLKRSSDEIEM